MLKNKESAWEILHVYLNQQILKYNQYCKNKLAKVDI